jgi:creatinine amidohydrolase
MRALLALLALVAAPARAQDAMTEMTFPEFHRAIVASEAVLLPVGSIEAHGPHLPLDTDARLAEAQLRDVQAALLRQGHRTMVGPSLNIGITHEGDDRARDGTAIYPGSLTVRFDTMVALYADVIESLADQGARRVFVYSGHLGGLHLRAVVAAVAEANRRVPGLRAHALIDSERLAVLKLAPGPHLLPIEQGLNFPMLARLLSRGAPGDFTTHADGWETSLALHYMPRRVRAGYRRLPHAPSRQFIDAQVRRDPAMNPNAMGGFPTRDASAAVGKRIADYRTRQIVAAIDRAWTN